MSRDAADFEQKAPASSKPEAKHRCNPEHGGCGLSFPKDAYNFTAMICRACAPSRASQYGFTLECVNMSNMDGLIPYYERQIPGFGSLDKVTQCRVLAIAAGSRGVMNETEKEKERALKVRAKFPHLYPHSDRPDNYLRIIEKGIKS